MNTFSPKTLEEGPLRIDANMVSSPMDVSFDGDIAMWDDHQSHHKMLSNEDITTPTGVEPFFDADHHQGIMFPTPSPIKRASHWNDATLRRFHEATYRHHRHEPQVEPSNEPCTEDIPWTDLVYWLGNSTTGQVECPCSTCHFERSQGRVPTAAAHHLHQQLAHFAHMPSSTYRRLSAKIPVIAVPRIEGVN